METILATAFGRVVNLQRGEGDQLTDSASTLFASAQRSSAFNGAQVTLIKC